MTRELSSTQNKLKDQEKAWKDNKERLDTDIAILKREKLEKAEELERVSKTLSSKEKKLNKKEKELVDSAI